MGLSKLLNKLKGNEPPLYGIQTYDAEASKRDQPFVYEHTDASWSTANYAIPKNFMKYYYVCFGKQAFEMLKSNAIDEGIPHYMDQNVHNATAEALSFLVHKHATHAESISDIIQIKKLQRNAWNENWKK